MELLHTAHVPAGDGPFPTVIALHGWGASAHDLFGLAPLVRFGDSEALVLCPQGSVEVPVGPGMTGHGWFPLVPGQPPDPEAFRRGSDQLQAFLDGAFERYPIDPERVVLLGFSQGGVMAFDRALRHPERYAGLVALATWLPEILAEDLPRSEAQKGFPTLILHGTEDSMVQVDRARETRERLRDFGVSLMYREFPMGHEIRPEALKVLMDWLGRRA